MSRRRCELPEDLLIDILLKMPAKSVGRLRCLSKFYRQLIDGPEFTRKHYDLSLKTSPRVLLEDTYKHMLLEIDYIAKVHELMDPGIKGGFILMGCSRGIICYCLDSSLVFWNPLTGASRRSYAGNFDGIYTPVLGYDAVNDDLKLLKILHHSSKLKWACMIYSSKKDSWSRIEGFSSRFNVGCGAEVFVKGSSCMNMLAYAKLSDTTKVLGFDFADEKFKLVSLPPNCDAILTLSSVDGCLCLYSRCATYSFDVWMMKEYGVEESWARVFNIQSSDSALFFTAYLVPLQLVAHSNGCPQLLVLSPYQHPGLYLFDIHQTQPTKLMDTASYHAASRHFLYAPTYRKP